MTIRIIKTSSCPSLSERSRLTYNIGCNPAIHFQVVANTGSGFFNDIWTSLNDIQMVVNQLPIGRVITSSTFHSLFAGKSNNSSGFLLAVLKHVRLVRHCKDKVRGYEFLDTSDFMAEMDVLIAALPEVEVIKKPVKVSKKPMPVTSLDTIVHPASSTPALP
jgi:hypothetical protein